MRRPSRIVILFASFAVAAAVGGYVWFTIHGFRRLDPATIDREVHIALPSGSSRSQIDAYLESRGYSHSDPFPAHEDTFIAMIASDVPVDAQVIWAVVNKNTRWWFDIRKGQVYIYLVLNGDGRLERILVAEHVTGP